MHRFIIMLVTILVGGSVEAASKSDLVVVLAPRCTIEFGDEAETLSRLQDLMQTAQGVAIRHLNKDRFLVDDPEAEASERVLAAQDCEEDQCIVDIMEPLGAAYAIGGSIAQVDNKITLTWRLWRRDVSTEFYRATAVSSISHTFKSASYTPIKRMVAQGTYAFTQRLNAFEAARRRKMIGSYAGAIALAAAGVWLFVETRRDLQGLRHAYDDASTEPDVVSAREGLESAVFANNLGVVGGIGLGTAAGAMTYLGYLFGQE